MKAIGIWLLIFKMALFVFTAVIIAPFIAMFGDGASFVVGISNVMHGYLNEAHEKGYITEEEKREIEKDMM